VPCSTSTGIYAKKGVEKISIQDQAICKALDRLHLELAGIRKPCRFHYNGREDYYYCEHGEVSGKLVIEATGLMRERD
jgi:hypothetical protein